MNTIIDFKHIILLTTLIALTACGSGGGNIKSITFLGYRKEEP